MGRYLEGSVAEPGRVAVLDWVLGEYLAVFTRVPTLGGIQQRNVPHVAAHPLRHDFRKRNERDDPLARYLEEYAVRAVVTAGPHDWLDARRDLVTPEEAIAGYRVYRVNRAPNYFALGRGRVVSQAPNEIEVTDAVGASLILRFHWLESLRCRPNCTVKKAPAEDDAAGFIRVDNPPRAFAIYNAY